MTTALARYDDAAPLAIQPGQEMWTAKQAAALAALGVKDCPKAELAVFMHYCQRTELDPFSRQIYYIKRREKVGNDWVDKWTTQVGIDGFRVMRDRVAARTGCTVEFEDTVWYDDDSQEYKVWVSPEPPAACKVVLVKYQDGRALRYAGVLRTASYMAMKDGKPVSQWRTQPEHMIEKCCEAFATRRAFPNDFSGLYIPEEMNGGDGPVPQVRRVRAADIIITRQGAEQVADRMGPADAEIVDDPGEAPGPPAAGAGPAATAPAATAPREVTAQEVNDHFKALGYTVREQKEVLHAAGVLASRKLPLGSIGELTADQLAVVAAALEGCDDKGDLVALLAQVSSGQDGGTDE